jgi:hypothetical protein
MIVHIVLFKWKQEAHSASIAATISALQELKHKIPFIIDLSCGQNLDSNHRNQGFQHGLVVKLPTRGDLDAYQNHEAHQKVLNNLIKPILAEVIALDYETE